jgi:uncharacterized membrane-anchored protein YitT (DUF2179 family)
MISFASVFIGIGINGFVLPSHLINGGMMGISLLINYLWGFKLAIIFTLLNLPIYILAMKYNLSLFFYGLFGTLVSAFSIHLLYPISGLFQLPLLPNVIFGGLFIGTGVGMMVKVNASPGGMDLLALIVSKWLSVNVGLVMILMDVSIILTGVWILEDERMLYSLVIVTIVGLMASIMTAIKSVRVYL